MYSNIWVFHFELRFEHSGFWSGFGLKIFFFPDWFRVWFRVDFKHDFRVHVSYNLFQAGVSFKIVLKLKKKFICMWIGTKWDWDECVKLFSILLQILKGYCSFFPLAIFFLLIEIIDNHEYKSINKYKRIYWDFFNTLFY